MIEGMLDRRNNSIFEGPGWEEAWHVWEWKRLEWKKLGSKSGQGPYIWILIGHNDVYLYPKGCRKLLKSLKQNYDVQYFTEFKTLNHMVDSNFGDVENVKSGILRIK